MIMITPYVPLFRDFLDQTQSLSNEQRGKLVRAYLQYAYQVRSEEEIEQSLDEDTRTAFYFMKDQADHHFAYMEKRRKNKDTEGEANENKKFL